MSTPSASFTSRRSVAAIGAPEVDGEVLTWMGRVVAHTLAEWLRDYEAPDGTTIGFDLGAAGSWTWRRDATQWTAHEGIDTPTTRVSVAPDGVVALLTRGVSVAEATELLTFSGDTELARAARWRARRRCLRIRDGRGRVPRLPLSGGGRARLRS